MEMVVQVRAPFALSQCEDAIVMRCVEAQHPKVMQKIRHSMLKTGTSGMACRLLKSVQSNSA
ncbi:hypothetical protein ASE07_09050 [Noviherbaspirillum sp. Root189]|nr:hypothetical protein ASE07_09050 [Noviherbaspirillum sp. Root189]